MECPLLNEQIEWEAHRVAAAFGVQKWQMTEAVHSYFVFESLEGTINTSWQIRSTGEWSRASRYRIEDDWSWAWVQLTDETKRFCLIFSTIRPPLWLLQPYPKHHELMARGLYRLGFNDKAILRQLTALSAHEKLELRLSLPREFWPPNWQNQD